MDGPRFARVHARMRAQQRSLLTKRFVKKQQMQWTHRGAHLLLQMRVKTINGELREAFTRWYPSFEAASPELAELPELAVAA